MTFKKLLPVLVLGFLQNGFSQSNTWQQQVDYVINVRLDDEKHTLSAFEKIDYTNNSGQELTFLYFHLWPNAYSSKNTALAQQFRENGDLKFEYATPDQMGYIDSLDFEVNGKKVKTELDPQNPDIIKLLLDQPIAAGEKAIITTPFRVKLPNSYSRLGHIGQAYQITQWYPKPAVFDASGWHQMPYLNQGEFYSEFGSFDVRISLPENYVLGSTGDLQTPEEEAFLNQKVKETEAYENYFNIDTVPSSSPKYKTVRYTQQNIHDFAWFADKRFHVLKGEVELPSHRKVTTWAMFTDAYAKYWKNSLEYLHDATYYYSLWNGEYAYKNVTAVDGALSAGGGMEYPNITVIGPVSSDLNLEIVIMHEVGHNWFYGMLGSNERIHGWMDEGLNSFNEMRYLMTKYPKRSLADYVGLDRFFKTDSAETPAFKLDDLYKLGYLFSARSNTDQPIETHSAEFTSMNYGTIMYQKTALAFRYLKAYLGESVFDKCMQSYFDKWHFRHPQPKDMQQVFEEVSGRKLDWFFGELIGTANKVDFAIEKVKRKEGELEVKVVSKTGFNGPVLISGLDKEGNTVLRTALDPAAFVSSLPDPEKKIRSLQIDAGQDIPELYRGNNAMRTKGLFKRIHPLEVKPLAGLDQSSARQVFVLPAIGYNYNDGGMLGAVIHNHSVPGKAWEWEAVPLYGLRSQRVNGTGSLGYNWYPKNTFQRIYFGAGYSSFSLRATPGIQLVDTAGKKIGTAINSRVFSRYQAKLIFDLKRPYPRSPIRQTIQLRGIFVSEHNRSQVNLDSSHSTSRSVYVEHSYAELSYDRKNQRSINPYSMNLVAQAGEDYARLSAKGIYMLNYPSSKKKAEFRLFGGMYLYNNSPGVAYAFYFSENYDYLYDHVLLDRSRLSGSILDKQLVSDDGGFKSFTTVAGSKKGLISLNAKAPVPFGLPLGVYAGAGWSNTSKGLVSEAGLYVPIAKNALEVYFPVYTSSDLSALKYGQRIRFLLAIERLNPVELLKTISF